MRLFLVLAAVAVLAAGCGSSHSTSSARSGPQAVTIAGYAYAPARLTVAPGTRVTFTNKDSAPHTATATGLDTGTLQQGKAKTLVLRTPGTYAYVCSFHPYMHGTIVVR